MNEQGTQQLPQRSSTGNFSSSPVSIGGVTSPKVTGKETFFDSQTEAPNVLLSMLEYYLFLFIRYPLAAPERSGSGVASTPVSSIPGVNVHRIQASTSNNGPSNNIRVVRETFGESLYYHIFRRCIRHFLPFEAEDNHRSIAIYHNDEFHESELFIRLVIAMWLEGQPRLSPNASILQSMMERRRHRSGFTNNDGATTMLLLDLSSSYDLTQSLGKYEPLPNQVHKCLRTLIIHIILDPAVHRDSLDSSTRFTYNKNNKLSLSPSIAILQQPVYNFVRSTFRYAPIHSSSESSFYGALNIWLIWLEPWNVTQRM